MFLDVFLFIFSNKDLYLLTYLLSELPLVKAIQPLNLCQIGSYYVNLTPWIYAAFIQLFSLFIQLGNKKTEINTTKQLLHELGLL